MEIRDASAADVATIVSFNQCLARETEGKTLPDETVLRGVSAVFADPARGRYFLACVKDRAVGQLMLTTEWSDWRNGQVWWIQSVYVAPDHRRGGVMRALFRHVEALARRSAGVVGLRLYVERNNATAQGAYRTVGMHDAGYIVFEKMLSGSAPSEVMEGDRP